MKRSPVRDEDSPGEKSCRISRIESPPLNIYIGVADPRRPMELSPATTTLIAELEAFAGMPLQRPGDFGVLLEMGSRPGLRGRLEALSFDAKFLSHTFRIMRRIGRDGTGYERLEQEFGVGVERVRTTAHDLLEGLADQEKRHFTSAYLGKTPAALENLLILCGDLSRYKNWLLDRQRMDP